MSQQFWANLTRLPKVEKPKRILVKKTVLIIAMKGKEFYSKDYDSIEEILMFNYVWKKYPAVIHEVRHYNDGSLKIGRSLKCNNVKTTKL